MSLKRPSFNLYMFTHNLSEYFLAKQCEKLNKFKKIKGNIGELQVLDTLNKLGGRFFSRFFINYYGDGGIDIQGFFNSTYYIIQVKFQVEKSGFGKIIKFKEKIQIFKNAIGIIFCPGGLTVSCKQKISSIKNIFFVESLNELTTKIQELSTGHRLERIKFEKPSWRLDDPNSIRRVFDVLKQQKVNLHSIRYSYDFPFDLENDVSNIGYVGFDYVGTFELKDTIHHVVVRNERQASRNVLEEKLEEFKKAKECYLPEYYFGIFLIDLWDYDVLPRLVQDSNIIVSSLNDVRSYLYRLF